jgi:hypothetical protein
MLAWWARRTLPENGTPAPTLANTHVSRKERNPICMFRESLANARDGELVQKMVLAVLVGL